MSQYPGGQPPQDPYYYGQPPQDPYAQQAQPSDPYFGQQPVDQYGRPYQQNTDPYYGQPPQDPYAQQAQQQQAYYAQAPYAGWQQPAPQAYRRSGAGGAAIVGIFLVVLGVWFMFRDEIALDFGRVWPAAAVVLGVLMVIAAFVPRRSR